MTELATRPASTPAPSATSQRRSLRDRVRAAPRPLVAILAAAAINVVAWAFVVAPLMAPDEINHMGYVQQLAETGHPPKGGSNAGLPYSTQQADAMFWGGLTGLVGVPEGRPTWSGIEQRRWQQVQRSLPAKLRRDGAGPTSVGAYPPLYYGYEAVAYKAAAGTGFFGQQLAARIANGLVYLVTIGLTWLLAGELLGRGARRTLATALTALLPQLAFLGGAVNPDTMLVAMSTALLLAGVRLVKRGPSLPRVAVLAALSAALILTHTRGLGIVTSALLALAIGARVHHIGWRRTLGFGGLLAAGIAAGGLLYLVTTTIVAAPPGTPAKPASPFSVLQFASYLWQFWLPGLPFMSSKIGGDYGFHQAAIETFFGQFASLEVRYPNPVYTVLHWWWIAVAAGLAVLALVRRQSVRAHLPVLLFLGVTVVALVGFLQVVAYRAMLSNPADPVIAGRYLLPLAPLGACAVAYVIGALPRRAFPWAAGLVLSGFVVLSLAGLEITLTRFYA
jgi:hypothetical protein